MLSDRQIKGIKPTAKHQYIADGRGLYLRVHPSGKKQFVHRTRAGGKATWMPLGDYPLLSLESARKQVRGTVASDTVRHLWGRKIAALRRKKTPGKS